MSIKINMEQSYHNNHPKVQGDPKVPAQQDFSNNSSASVKEKD